MTCALLRRLWSWAFSLVLVYAVSIGVFPAVVGMLAAVSGPPWWRALFIPVLFVTFNVGDTLGRNAPARWLLTNPRWVLRAAMSRFIFVPLFLLAHMRQVIGRVHVTRLCRAHSPGLEAAPLASRQG